MSSAFNIPDNDAPSLPLHQQFKDAFRATGYVTNGQAWELADAAMTVHRKALAAAPTPPIDAVPGEPVAPPQTTALGFLPCPFCGSSARFSFGNDGEVVNVRCVKWGDGCMGAGPNEYSRDKARDGWNQRAASVASRAGSEPVELDEVAIEQALSALDSIARKQRQVADTIEPIRTINDAAKLAGCAHARLHQALVVRDYKREKEGRVLAAIAPAAAAPTKIAGLGRMTDEDDGYLTLEFVSEDAAQDFMLSHEPSVELDDMPPRRPEAAPQATAASAQALGEAGEVKP